MFWLISHDDHNDPATNGYTIIGILNLNFEYFNKFAHVSSVLWCGDTNITSISVRSSLWPV